MKKPLVSGMGLILSLCLSSCGGVISKPSNSDITDSQKVNNKYQKESSNVTKDDNTSIRVALNNILSKTICEADKHSDVDCVRLYFTERYNSHYRNACNKAEREGCEYPKIWWSYSDSDPEKFTIKDVRITSSNEAKAFVGMSSELYVADFDIILKKENGRWLIDNVDEKSIENNTESDVYNDDDTEDSYYQESESSSSRTFYSEQIVIGYLANQSFHSSDGLTMKVDGSGRLYVDGDYAGVLSVLRYNSTSALLRFGGGVYGEGKLTVNIVGDKFILTDPTDGTVYYQK